MTAKRLLVSMEESRQLLGGVSRSTVYELAAEGRLTKVNIGTRSFITAESLDGFIEALISESQTKEKLQ